jgi:nicotinamide mononucleotide transporter
MHAMQDLWQQLIAGLWATTWLEFIAVFFGITSVLLSRKEHIGVYPTGIINTSIYIYLSMVAGLYAEASVNIYYTVMSVVGWVMWSSKQNDGDSLRITRSTQKEWINALIFFGLCWAILWVVLHKYTDSNVPIADGFASATAYTGMWLMARKKLENWLWWIATNITAVPLYFIKGYVFTSFQYIVFLMLAVLGWIEWKKRVMSYEG